MNNPNPPAAASGHPKVMIVAGEASGDLHGSNLITHMRRQHHGPEIEFFGIGGERMREAGIDIIVESSQLSVVGITEVFVRLPDILKGMATAKNALHKRKPDLLILIDFPDFNLRLASHAQKAGVPVFYYITPQVWAWRKSRIKTIKKQVDQAAVIFPFEEALFQEHGVPATFVGHPLLDAGYSLPFPGSNEEQSAPKPGSELALQHRITVGLLPGSRDKEIERHLPIMMAAAEQISGQLPTAIFLISCAPSVDADRLEQIAQQFRDRVSLEIIPGNVGNTLSRSTLAIAVSGTVTLEAGLFAVPMVVIYKFSTLSYLLGKLLVSVPNFSLVNIVAQKEIVPELLQHEASPHNIADHICALANNTDLYRKMKADLLDLRKKMGGAGASSRAANIALGMLHP